MVVLDTNVLHMDLVVYLVYSKNLFPFWIIQMSGSLYEQTWCCQKLRNFRKRKNIHNYQKT